MNRNLDSNFYSTFFKINEIRYMITYLIEGDYER